MSKIFYLDLETTGLNPRKHGVIQLAGIIEIDGEVKEQFSFDISTFPMDIIDQEALAINGVSEDDIKYTFRPPMEAYRELLGIMGKYVDKFNRQDKFFLVGYNVKFDADFLRAWFGKAGDNYFGSWFFTPYLDVMTMAGVDLMKQRPTMKNFKLESVGPLFAAVEQEQLHGAAYDIKLTREIFNTLYQKWGCHV